MACEGHSIRFLCTFAQEVLSTLVGFQLCFLSSPTYVLASCFLSSARAPLRHDEIQDKQDGQDEERDVEPLNPIRRINASLYFYREVHIGEISNITLGFIFA